MDKKEEQKLLEELNRQGFTVRQLASWPAKSTYYKPNGEALPNLPSDPYSMQRYLRRGFTLAPPVLPSAGEVGIGSAVIIDDGRIDKSPLACPEPGCGFEAKSLFGLKAHMRKHERESKEGEE